MSGPQTQLRSRDGRYAPDQYADPGQIEDLVDPDLADMIARTSRGMAASYGTHGSANFDADDIEQDAWLAVLEARARTPSSTQGSMRSDEVVTIPAVTRPTNEFKLAATVIARNAGKHLRGGRGDSGREYAAYREFQRRLAALPDGGASLTHRDKSEIADQIRLAEPPGRRPVADFWQSRAIGVELDESVGRATERTMDMQGEKSFPEGSIGVRALELRESGGGRASTAAAVKLAWDAIAEHSDLPRVTQQALSDDRAAAARAVIRGGGGAVRVATNFLGGQATHEQVDALFAAFPEVGTADARAIAEKLIELPAHADDLFSASISAATRARAPRIRGPR